LTSCEETALAYGSNGLGPDQLVTLAMKHRLYLRRQDRVTLDMIRAEIDAGRPIICLGAYRALPQPVDHDNTPFKDGHWLVAEGYDPSHIVCDDPDVWFPYVERGHNIPYFDDDFAEFLAGTGNICLFVLENQPMTINEELDAALVQIGQLNDHARTLLAQMPIPAPVPPPAGSIQVKRNRMEPTSAKVLRPKATAIAVLRWRCSECQGCQCHF